MPTKKSKKHIKSKPSPKPKPRRKPFIAGSPDPYTPHLYRKTRKK